MFTDKLSDYFEGAAAKYLSVVDAEPKASNQHEIGGLPKAGFRKFLGTPKADDKLYFSSRQVYIADELSEPIITESMVSWYDCRYGKPRHPEYRLYYYDNPVVENISPGDLCLIAKQKDGKLLIVFTPRGGTVEGQLRTLFGLEAVSEQMKPGKLDTVSLLLPLRLMLESLGIELQETTETDSHWLSIMIEKFGGDDFPSTKDFASFARNSVSKQVDPVRDPDDTLMTWMDQEERFFKIYERHLVQDRLKQGFGVNGEDVEQFIDFSLRVQNRRKSRVGHAFESHLDELFRKNGLKFEQGRGKGKTTENNSKPDFVFPSFVAYKDQAFPSEKLAMLGAKTTCKDRWRQVLSEAARIHNKHLITLEPSISAAQTDEMAAHNLQLVVPKILHETYAVAQRGQLLDLSSFISIMKEKQASSSKSI